MLSKKTRAAITERRKQVGLSMAALSERIGRSPAYMSLVEGGHVKNVDLSTIASALECDVADLELQSSTNGAGEHTSSVPRKRARKSPPPKLDQHSPNPAGNGSWPLTVTLSVNNERDAAFVIRLLSEENAMLREQLHSLEQRAR